MLGSQDTHFITRQALQVHPNSTTVNSLLNHNHAWFRFVYFLFLKFPLFFFSFFLGQEFSFLFFFLIIQSFLFFYSSLPGSLSHPFLVLTRGQTVFMLLPGKAVEVRIQTQLV